MDVDQLGLRGAALAGARALKAAHPGVIFTSGRRGVEDQARAMAQNVIRNRQWIGQTYLRTPESAALQRWVDRNPGADQATLQAAFGAMMRPWTEDQRARLSRHFSGDAFDVHPLAPGAEAERVKAAIRALPGLTKFLEHEGGLMRWHAQFG